MVTKILTRRSLLFTSPLTAPPRDGTDVAFANVGTPAKRALAFAPGLGSHHERETARADARVCQRGGGSPRQHSGSNKSI